MELVIISLTPVVVLLGYSAYQIHSARWERQDMRVDRFRMLLAIIVALDVPLVYSPFWVPQWNALGNGMLERIVVIFSGVLPLVSGGWAAIRRGPARIALPAVCLVLVMYASFVYWFIWVADFVFA